MTTVIAKTSNFGILSRLDIFRLAANFMHLKVNEITYTAEYFEHLTSIAHTIPVDSIQLNRDQVAELSQKGIRIPTIWFAPWANEETREMFPDGYTQNGWLAQEPIVTMPIQLCFAFHLDMKRGRVRMVPCAQGHQFAEVDESKELVEALIRFLPNKTTSFCEVMRQPSREIIVSTESLGIGEVQNLWHLLWECFPGKTIRFLTLDIVPSARPSFIPAITNENNMQQLYVPVERCEEVKDSWKASLEAYKQEVVAL